MNQDQPWVETLAHFRAGALGAAEQGCRAVLARSPDRRDARNLLAVLCCQTGRLEQGITLCREVLTQAPDDVQALQTLGDALHLREEFAEAASVFARLLALRGKSWQVCAKLAAALLKAGRRPESIAAYRDALALGAPERVGQDCALAEFEWGLELYHQGRRDDAILAYRAALARRPDLAVVHCNLGVILQEKGDLDGAIACYEAALALAPAYPDALSNLGVACHDQGRLEEAIAHLEAALRLQPEHPFVLNNLGRAWQDLGQFDLALSLFRRAAARRPDYAEARFNESLLLLMRGDYAAGWPGYEWRWRRVGMQRPDFGLPLWDGSPLAGRTLLVYCEQGLGDSIQFLRFLPWIAAAGGQAVVLVPPELDGLFRDLAGMARVFTRISALPVCDVQAPLLSLPGLFGLSLANLPAAPVPYLTVPPEPAAVWRQRLADRPGRKIGLVWRGRPEHTNDRNRSLDPALLAPLLDLPGLTVVSLQKGARPGDQDVFARCPSFLDLAPELSDFTATAATIAALDLVISVDTSVIHLAGALGRPGWLLLPFIPDWRWLCDRTDSPWYPTLRLFRQPARNDWPSVVAAVVAALTDAEGESSGRKADQDV